MSNSVESLTMKDSEPINSNSEDDSEEDSDDDEIYVNQNKERKPFRDALSRVRASSPTPSKSSTTSKTKLDADEIRQRVKKGMMGKGAKSAIKTGGKSRNVVKSSSKREARSAAKDGKSGFWG
ncbi:UNVERIFIED_CONTAM: hypothetical protein HDU68_007148 [Siphonaria sp. JEL0065]|nr:hypothetical protein HDU68_007148 [Siphonaria sp. JEL0065]